MATRAPSETSVNRGLSHRTLMTLGMFLFGMDTLAYHEMQRKMDWRHGKSERHGARPASQFLGPGEDTVTLGGTLVPELQGSYGALARLIEMAATGDSWPLVDGNGEVLGNYEIKAVDQRLRSIMAGGLARAVDFGIDLVRVD